MMIDRVEIVTREEIHVLHRDETMIVEIDEEMIAIDTEETKETVVIETLEKVEMIEIVIETTIENLTREEEKEVNQKTGIEAQVLIENSIEEIHRIKSISR
jgi:hypothetical protein